MNGITVVAVVLFRGRDNMYVNDDLIHRTDTTAEATD